MEHLNIESQNSENKVVLTVLNHQGDKLAIKTSPQYANFYFSSLLLARFGVRCPQLNPISQLNHRDEFKRMLLAVDWATRADVSSRKVAKAALLGN